MNKKVFKTMIALVVIFLLGLYVLKIFFPEQFVLSVELQPLVDIGNYIDTHAWAEYSFGILTSFITYWLYLCAACKRWYLKWYECLIVLFVIGINIGLTFFDINVYSAFSIISFVALPLLFGGNLMSVTICYSVHLISQGMTLTIRNLPLYMSAINTLTLNIVGLESYFWLFLLYWLFNYKKEGRLWVGNIHHFTDKTTSVTQSKSENLKSELSNTKKPLNHLKQIKLYIKNGLTRDTLKRKFRELKLDIKDFIIYDLWVYIIVLGSIALCAWIFNKWIEAIMFCIAHICIRRVFEKQFHFSSTAYCLTLTLGIVWFAIPVTLPMASSLLSSIIIAFAICFVGYLAQDRVDLMKLVKGKQKFDFKNCTKEQVIEVCNDLGYNKDKQDLAVMFFVDKLSNKEVWQELCNTQRNVEWDTVKQYHYRIKKDFKSVIKNEEE